MVFLLFSLFVLLCTSCNENKGEYETLLSAPVVAEYMPYRGDSMLVADFEKIRNGSTIDFPMSEFCEWYKLVKLDNSSKEIMLPNIAWFIASDNYIMAGDGGDPLQLFNIDGKYLCQVGEKEGPGGYNGYYEPGYINEEKQEILLPVFRAIKVYNLRTGKVINSITPTNTLVPRNVIPWSEDTYLYSTEPDERYEERLTLEEVNHEGKHISGFPSKYFLHDGYVNDWGEHWAYNSWVDILRINADEIAFYPSPVYSTKDTIFHYHVKQEDLKPVFTMRYTGNVMQHRYSESSHYYYATYMVPNNVPLEFNGWSNRPSIKILIDRRTGKGSMVNLCLDKHGWLDISAGRSWVFNGYFTLNLTPDNLMLMIEHELKQEDTTEENRKKLQELYDSITEDDNNYAVIGKLR